MEQLTYAGWQPLALFNQKCHLNCLWWAREHGLKFAWTVQHTGDVKRRWVHSVCLNADGLVIDPTLGLWGAACTTYRIDHPAPATVALAMVMLTKLQKQYQRSPWWGWLIDRPPFTEETKPRTAPP